MSGTGALVEGGVVPGVGALVQLIRGSLIVHALVAWSAAGRCGLRFSGTVDVHQWRAAPANREQQRVDEVVRLVKAGAVPLPVPPLDRPGRTKLPSEPGRQLSDDLRRACELLEDLGAVLAGDSDIVMLHGPKLQNLDIAMQIIAAVETIISGNSNTSCDETKLLGLGRSADQALQRDV
jgi:hypothetical protein